MAVDFHDIIIRVRTIVDRNVAGFNKVMGMTQQQFGETATKAGKLDKRFSSLNNISGRVAFQMRKLTLGFGRFKMELLSVMFFGMMLSAIMFGLLRPAFDLVGIFDLLNVTLGVLFLPIALMLLDVLLPIMMWFINLPDPIKRAIGIIVLLIGIVGAALFMLGSFGLGIGGLIMVFGKLLLPIMVIGGAIMGLIAILTAAGVDWGAVLKVMLNIAMMVFGAIWAVVKFNIDLVMGIIGVVGDFILGFIEGVVGHKVTWEDIWSAIWNAVQMAWKFIGPTIKFIGESVKWLLGVIRPAMKMLGGFARVAGGVVGTLARFALPLTFLPMFGDVIWRPGHSPIAVSPEDTVVATRGGIGGGGVFNINIDINASGVSVDELAKEIGDRIESELRMRSR